MSGAVPLHLLTPLGYGQGLQLFLPRLICNNLKSMVLNFVGKDT